MKKLTLLILISFYLWPVASQAQVSDLSAKLEQLRAQIQAVNGRTFTPVSSSAIAPVPTAAAVGINRTLSLGSEGEDVRRLQNFLKTKGYFKQEATGFFGPVTVEAVRKWQLDEKIVTIAANGGIVGPRTLAVLGGVLGTTGSASGGGTTSVGAGPMRFLVTSPSAGQSFTRGEQMSVSWIMAQALATPIVDPNSDTRIVEKSALNQVPKVDIILIKSGGQPHRLVANLNNRGFANFVIPTSLEAGNYFAKVVSTDGTLSATSETFSLR